jgi:phage tail sheath gpL-like
VPSVPIPIGSVGQAIALFGQGSMLSREIQAFFNVNTIGLLYALPVPDPAVGVRATGSVTIATPPTASGVLTIYIAGQPVSVSVAQTDVATVIATNLAAAINALVSLPVTAVAASTAVNITCRWAGLTGNDITIIPNFYGVLNGEVLPAGVTLTIVAMASGTGAPSMVAAISAIQMLEFAFVCMPYTDVASMAAWNNEYGFSSGGRWNFSRQQYGIIFNAYRNTFSLAITNGLTSWNSPVMTTMYVEPLAPTPIWEWAATYCGLAALAFTDDPARPLQTLELLGCIPASLQNRSTQAQLNNLTNGGYAIQAVDPSGTPMILREQMQYQFNSFGQGDTAFGLATVLATLSELLRRMRAAITSKFPRMKLVPDGTKLSPGQAAVTPTDIKAELISEFIAAEFDGLVADLPDFQTNLIVQIDPQNPNKLQVLWPPQLAGQLRQFDVLAQFRLMYPPVTLT